MSHSAHTYTQPQGMPTWSMAHCFSQATHPTPKIREGPNKAKKKKIFFKPNKAICSKCFSGLGSSPESCVTLSYQASRALSSPLIWDIPTFSFLTLTGWRVQSCQLLCRMSLRLGRIFSHYQLYIVSFLPECYRSNVTFFSGQGIGRQRYPFVPSLVTLTLVGLLKWCLPSLYLPFLINNYFLERSVETVNILFLNRLPATCFCNPWGLLPGFLIGWWFSSAFMLYLGILQ